MNVKINGLYKHYKGNVYKVLNVAQHTETFETLVIYQDVDNNDKIWARPISMWNDDVLVNDKFVKRFSLIK